MSSTASGGGGMGSKPGGVPLAREEEELMVTEDDYSECDQEDLLGNCEPPTYEETSNLSSHYESIADATSEYNSNPAPQINRKVTTLINWYHFLGITPLLHNDKAWNSLLL